MDTAMNSGIRTKKGTEKMSKRENRPKPTRPIRQGFNVFIQDDDTGMKGYQPLRSRPLHERKPPRGTSNYRPPPRDNRDKTK